MSELPVSDDELMARLSGVAAVADPVAAALPSAARAAFGLRDFDAQVAELIRDSAVDVPATVVRGPGPRMLSFESGAAAIDREVTPDAARRDIFGRLVGSTAPAVEAQVPEQ